MALQGNVERMAHGLTCGAQRTHIHMCTWRVLRRVLRMAYASLVTRSLTLSLSHGGPMRHATRRTLVALVTLSLAVLDIGIASARPGSTAGEGGSFFWRAGASGGALPRISRPSEKGSGGSSGFFGKGADTVGGVVDGRRDPSRPLRHLTPGRRLTSRWAVFCQPGWAERSRSVSASRRRAVYRRYGLDGRDPAVRLAYVVDHLIPKELGGADSLTNLYPMPRGVALVKDSVEDWAHARACRLKSLAETRRLQRGFARDWHALYGEMKQRGDER